MTVFEVLHWSTNYLEGQEIENPRLNAELLLAHSLNISREGLYVRLKNNMKREEKETFENLIKRRISGEPLQYILGHQEFWSIDLKVDSRVLIPRPDTELLVEQALSVLFETSSKGHPLVLEIGTGSGAVAISLAKEVKDIFLVATDISREALLLAKENAESLGLLDRVHFVNGNLLDPFHLLKGGTPFDMILSNPPYITSSAIGGLAREVKDYEPGIALEGGEDGLAFYRVIISQAPAYLKEGGWLLLEVGQGQAERVSELIEKKGDFFAPERFRDLPGIERVVKAQRKSKQAPEHRPGH
jgi:release factor glutamine methyltransferase